MKTNMNNLRKYGSAPFSVAVIHGGPGAAGEMQPVAEELSKNFGVLEPLQTTASLEGQVRELKAVLERDGSLPIILIGHSWGAWLAYILAAKSPKLVKKLILVGSGPFEAKYTKGMLATRLSRLNDHDRQEAVFLLLELNQNRYCNPGTLEKVGQLISKADSFNPMPNNGVEVDVRQDIDVQQDIYQGVWPEADKLRKSGELLKLGEKIQCPVVAVHGDYDPHPAAGVREPLSGVVKDFHFILLNKCGHDPWREKEAKDKFYGILKEECATGI